LRKDPLESIDSGFKVEKTFSTIFGVAAPEMMNGRQPAGVR
ncbi:MAG: magnesium chelatase ATPase subunit I, partial [Cyanobacteria bacterium J06623_4]